MENYISLKICRKFDYGLKSFQAGIDISIRFRSPHCCKSPENELIELLRIISAWYYGKGLLIKSLHMLQLSEMIEKLPGTFFPPFSIVHSVFHK